MLNLFNKNKEEFQDLEEYDDLLDNNLEEIEKMDTYNDISFESSYEDDEKIDEDFTDYLIEENSNEKSNKYDKNKSNKRIRFYTNLFFSLIIILLVLVSVDIICVTKYQIGPFFAMKTSTYKDGGTKVYYGLGYKVIKYHQEQGRRDIEIGPWDIKYSIEPLDTTDLDLAIEFVNIPQETAEKYSNKFVRLSSKVKKVDEKNNTLILEYYDVDEKYTLDIYCKMIDEKSNITIFKQDDKANILGTITTFKLKDKKGPNTVYIENCFAEKVVEEIITENE